MLDMTCPRCPNCNKKFGDSLDGMYETLCPRCKRFVRVIGSNGRYQALAYLDKRDEHPVVSKIS